MLLCGENSFEPLVLDVAMSGVVFTRTLTHGAPYYVLNYDDLTSRTDSVTSGAAHELRTIFVRWSRREQALALDPRIGPVLDAASELEELVGHSSLDIEFAVQRDGRVTNIRVLRSLDQTFGLDMKAIEAARKWEFEPGTRFGEPVPVLVNIELEFNLR